MLDDAFAQVAGCRLREKTAVLQGQWPIHAKPLINCLDLGVTDVAAGHDANWVARHELNCEESEQRHPDQNRQCVQEPGNDVADGCHVLACFWNDEDRPQRPVLCRWSGRTTCRATCSSATTSR